MNEIIECLKDYVNNIQFIPDKDSVVFYLPSTLFMNSAENANIEIKISKDKQLDKIIISDGGSFFRLLNDYEYDFTEEEFDLSINKVKEDFDFDVDNYTIKVQTNNEKFCEGLTNYLSIITLFTTYFEYLV